MKNKEIKIAYNTAGPMFSVKNQEVESITLEGAVLDTFLRKYNQRPTFIFANIGTKNEISGLWNGVIGLVRYVFFLRLDCSPSLPTSRVKLCQTALD